MYDVFTYWALDKDNRWLYFQLTDENANNEKIVVIFYYVWGCVYYDQINLKKQWLKKHCWLGISLLFFGTENILLQI